MKTLLGSALFALLALASYKSFAGPAELAEIRQGCLTQVGLRCDCIMQSANALTDKEQAYVAAMFSQNVARLQALIPGMSQTEPSNANGFFTSSARACSGRGN